MPCGKGRKRRNPASRHSDDRRDWRACHSRGYRIRTCGLLRPRQTAPNPNDSSNQEVASSQQDGCTNGCTSDGKNEQADKLAMLAAAVNALTPEDRARLAAMLAGQVEGG